MCYTLTMKRLFRVSFDLLIISIVPVLSWILLGFILDSNLANTFSLTYPLQCLIGAIVAIFGTGANISKYRDKNRSATDNGIFYGILMSTLLFTFIIVNCDSYIEFMNMDAEIYRTFCIYSLIQILCQIILMLNLNKYYYQNKNQQANKIASFYNLINLMTLIGTAIITRNQIITSIVASAVLILMSIVISLKTIRKIDFHLNFKNCIRYDSSALSCSILHFLTYLFGFSNSFQFGEEYMTAINFATIVTDTQWDAANAIDTVAKVDLAKQKFNTQQHIKNAFKLHSCFIISILLLSAALFPFYKPNLLITGVIIGLHILDFAADSIPRVKMCFLQLEDSALKNTTHLSIAQLLRFILSFLPTPFCTIIGQICSSAYELVFSQLNYRKYITAQQRLVATNPIIINEASGSLEN